MGSTPWAWRNGAGPFIKLVACGKSVFPTSRDGAPGKWQTRKRFTRTGRCQMMRIAACVALAIGIDGLNPWRIQALTGLRSLKVQLRPDRQIIRLLSREKTKLRIIRKPLMNCESRVGLGDRCDYVLIQKQWTSHVRKVKRAMESKHIKCSNPTCKKTNTLF